jgi:hypothetical protein
MKMPLSEIIDRYTITKLKSERTSEDVSHELDSYCSEIEQYGLDSTQVFVEKLYEINGRLWDTEVKASRGTSSDNIDYAEIGKLAIKVREINCERNGVKADIVDAFAEGFKEIKINYTKTNYGKNT